MLEMSRKVESIAFVSALDYLLAEGDFSFFVFETKNVKLTSGIKEKIRSYLGSLEKGSSGSKGFEEGEVPCQAGDETKSLRLRKN